MSTTEDVRPAPQPGAGARYAPTAGAVWPVAAAPEPRTLVEVLTETAARWPDAPAVDAGGELLTYRRLLADAGQLARRLAAEGVGRGSRVGVRVPSGTPELYLAVLAVLLAGAAYVPVDADDPDERAQLVWADAGVQVVVGAGLALERRGPGGAAVAGPPLPADDAWIIFTSGTTGRPKGVAVSHRSAAAFVDAEARLFLPQSPLGPGDRVLAGLSVAFDASCEEMWLAWRHGACLVPAPRALVRSGAELAPWLVEQRVTVVSTVPTLAALWPVSALERVRLLVLGGEACPPELVARLAAPGRELWNTYGPTETTVVACAALLTPGQPVRIGAPLDGWELAVVDPEGKPVAWFETGELLVGGVGVARYLDPVRDAERFAPSPALSSARVYRTGDLVVADPDGLVFVGRADEQVKLAGRRVELGEIDAALQALPGVHAAAAAVQRTPAGGQVLVGYVVADPAGELDLGAARAELLERLPRALVPVLAQVEALPTRTSGKVDRAALPWPLDLPDAAGGDELAGTEAWLADQWQALLGLPVSADSDFFSVGGTSLAAARLLTAVRERFATASVADLYAHPVLRDLAAYLDALPSAPQRPNRPLPRRTPRRAGAVQALVLGALSLVGGARWLLGLGVLDDLVGRQLPWVPHTSWWLLGCGWLLLGSAAGRALLCALLARGLTTGLRPGAYPRGGAVHLRLWAAERAVAQFNLAGLLGTPWARHYARLLGCRVGRDVDLHALPPVTGLARFGTGCAVEPEADLAGWWLDGDLLRLGALDIGAGARVGARSMLLPGAVVGAGAVVAPGACVAGEVPAGAEWHGSPARPVEPEQEQVWPAPRHRRSRRWDAAYGLALLGLGLLPWLAAAPALGVLWAVLDLGRHPGLGRILTQLLLLSPPLAILTTGCYAGSVALLVRWCSRGIRPGFHPAHGRTGWCVWLVHQLVAGSRSTLFPLYASLLTPAWLRLLGARVGRRVELSTVSGLPSLLRVDDAAFLADDTLVAPFELRGGWLRLGRSHVGERAFVGNSGIVGPGRELPDGALLGVLSDAPAWAAPGTSWLGRPPMALPRMAAQSDPARTFDPPRRLVLARAGVELCRLLPVVVSVWLGDLALGALQFTVDHESWPLRLLGAAVVATALGVVALALTTAAKWLLMGRFRAGEHPLWSPFVWRNELFDCFLETVAMPWLGSALLGTPMLAWWLRTLGARIGPGAWLETHWLPEPDLVSIGAGASVNRGTVLQTHLFHDRLMRLDAVRLEAGATLGPHAIALPASRVGAGAVVASSSLVMGGEELPTGSSWAGNPVLPADGGLA